MNFRELVTRSNDIKVKYRTKNLEDGHKEWTVSDYMSGFVKDVGDLSKLIMAQQNLRSFDGNLEDALKHELGDCLWSLIIICEELGIDPKDALNKTLTDLEERL